MTAFSVTDAVDRYVASQEKPRVPDGTWHPSAIFGCLRQATYAARSTPESDPKQPRDKRVLRIGHIFHEFVQEAIAKYPGVTAYCELDIAIPVLKVTGSLDVLVEFEDGRYELIELKTINSKAFAYHDLPKEDHVKQVSAYMMALREVGAADQFISPLHDDLQRARIVYISKDDLRIEEFTVIHSESREVEIAERIAVLESHRAAGTLPDRLPDTVDSKTGKPRHDWRCGYCVWATTCWEGT